jgi:hypothetical protein
MYVSCLVIDKKADSAVFFETADWTESLITSKHQAQFSGTTGPPGAFGPVIRQRSCS